MRDAKDEYFHVVSLLHKREIVKQKVLTIYVCFDTSQFKEIVRMKKQDKRHSCKESASWLRNKAKTLREEADRLEKLAVELEQAAELPVPPPVGQYDALPVTGKEVTKNVKKKRKRAKTYSTKVATNGTGVLSLPENAKELITNALAENKRLRPRKLAELTGMSAEAVSSVVRTNPGAFKLYGPGWIGVK